MTQEDFEDNEVEAIKKLLESERSEKAKEAREDARALIYKLAFAGHKRVEIEFYGSGDDGSIHDISVDDGDYDGQQYDEAIRTWAYKVLEGTDVDWVNNEGGHGTIVIDVEARRYQFQVFQYEQTSSLALEDDVEVPAYEGAPIEEEV